MGTTSSKNKIDAMNNIVTQIATKNALSCGTSTFQTQNASQSMFGINIGSTQTIRQNTTIKSECLQDAQRANSLANDIANALTQYADSTGTAVSTTSTKSENATTIKNKVTTALTASNITSNYNSVMQQQIANQQMGGLSIFTKQESIQGADVYAKAVLQTLETNDVIGSIANTIDQTSTSKTEGLFDWIGTYLIWIIIAFVLVALGMLYVINQNPWLVTSVLAAFGFSSNAPRLKRKIDANKPALNKPNQPLNKPLPTQPLPNQPAQPLPKPVVNKPLPELNIANPAQPLPQQPLQPPPPPPSLQTPLPPPPPSLPPPPGALRQPPISPPLPQNNPGETLTVPF